MTFLFSLLSFCFHVPLLRFLGASKENMVFARTYLFWVVILGGIPTMMSMTLAHFLRGKGNVQTGALKYSSIDPDEQNIWTVWNNLDPADH